MPTRVRYPMIGRKYDHYKGGQYEVMHIATHTETNEPTVIYRSLIFGGMYARPLSLWFDKVETDAGERERFEIIPE